jgi:hypothetical protein
VAWAAGLERRSGCGAVEDCRHVTARSSGSCSRRRAAGEGAAEADGARAAQGRTRGKSDAIDALAAARCRVSRSRTSTSRPGEERLPELKLLVVHRTISSTTPPLPACGCAGICTSSTRAYRAARRARPDSPARTGRALGSPRAKQSVQARIARDLVSRCRSLGRAISELERELATLTRRPPPALLELPGCERLTAAKLLCEIGPIEPLPDRRAARPSRWRRTAHEERLGPHPPPLGSDAAATASSLRPAPHRDTRRRASPRRARLPRAANRAKARAAARAIRCLKRQLARVVFNTLKASPTLT